MKRMVDHRSTETLTDKKVSKSYTLQKGKTSIFFFILGFTACHSIKASFDKKNAHLVFPESGLCSGKSHKSCLTNKVLIFT